MRDTCIDHPQQLILYLVLILDYFMSNIHELNNDFLSAVSQVLCHFDPHVLFNGPFHWLHYLEPDFFKTGEVQGQYILDTV